MSRLSPDSLFHFTPTLENLQGILENTFYPRYCYEEFDLLDRGSQISAHFIEDALPMVCFCDIPLSQLLDHIKRYGEYGLGMSKQWGTKKKLNLVIYFNKGSHLSEIMSTMTETLILNHSSALQTFSETHSYMKPYEGTLYRRGRPVKKGIRFYDEHEWRYVPSDKILKSHNIRTFIQRRICMNSEELKKENRKLEIDQIKLTFNANDIRYIIIKNENEINHMVDKLREIKSGRGYDPNTIDRLTSHIITVERIKTDF